MHPFFTYWEHHPEPLDGFTRADWESLSPGMRREIVRDFERRPDRKFAVTFENISSEEILQIMQFFR